MGGTQEWELKQIKADFDSLPNDNAHYKERQELNEKYKSKYQAYAQHMRSGHVEPSSYYKSSLM